MPFSYYRNLSPRQKAIYRASASIERLPLPDAEGAAALARDLKKALETGDREEVQRSAQRLCTRICAELMVAPVRLTVRQKRPTGRGAELHGLYEREPDRTCTITIWMRTARKRRVVAFKTFLRTVLHELCHHLDYELLGLEDSFHTEGFFKREAHLARQLLAGDGRDDDGVEKNRRGSAEKPPAGTAGGEEKAQRRQGTAPASGQLALPFATSSGAGGKRPRS